MPTETIILGNQADEPTAIDTTEPTVSTTMAPVAGDLTVEELAAALEKVGAKKLIAALELVPEVNAAVVKHVLRQHKRPCISKEMTDALRAGLDTRTVPAIHAAFSKIAMELGQLHLDRNDIAIVVRKPSDAAYEPESDEPAPYGQGASRLIPAGNGEAPVAGPDYSVPTDLGIPPFLDRRPPRLA